MQSVFLNYYQRIMLAAMVGGIQLGNLKEASVYLRILEKIRLSDEELRESQFLQTQTGSTWQLPSLTYGSGNYEFETEESAAIVKALETSPQIRVSDAEWMLKLVDTLKAGDALRDSVVQTNA